MVVDTEFCVHVVEMARKTSAPAGDRQPTWQQCVWPLRYQEEMRTVCDLANYMLFLFHVAITPHRCVICLYKGRSIRCLTAAADRCVSSSYIELNYGRPIFLPSGFFFYLLSFYLFSSPNLSRRRLDVCHTSTHGVALVRI